ncbi:MAG: KR domain-containing protein, partial [Leptothrix sp. (in: b-proteobacteria)]
MNSPIPPPHSTPPTLHLTVLTGASRGLGLAMARQILMRAPPQHLLALSRRAADSDDELLALAEAGGHRFESWSQDLADAPAAAQRLADWLAGQHPSRHRRVDLI